jgi:hypothetical protein
MFSSFFLKPPNSPLAMMSSRASTLTLASTHLRQILAKRPCKRVSARRRKGRLHVSSSASPSARRHHAGSSSPTSFRTPIPSMHQTINKEPHYHRWPSSPTTIHINNRIVANTHGLHQHYSWAWAAWPARPVPTRPKNPRPGLHVG